MNEPGLTTIVVQFFAKPGQGAQLRDAVTQDMPRLSSLEGFRGGSLYYDIDEPDRVVLIEHWASVEQHKAYVERIDSDGTMDRISPMLAEPPRRRYLAPV